MFVQFISAFLLFIGLMTTFLSNGRVLSFKYGMNFLSPTLAFNDSTVFFNSFSLWVSVSSSEAATIYLYRRRWHHIFVVCLILSNRDHFLHIFICILFEMAGAKCLCVALWKQRSIATLNNFFVWPYYEIFNFMLC